MANHRESTLYYLARACRLNVYQWQLQCHCSSKIRTLHSSPAVTNPIGMTERGYEYNNQLQIAYIVLSLQKLIAVDQGVMSSTALLESWFNDIGPIHMLATIGYHHNKGSE